MFLKVSLVGLQQSNNSVVQTFWILQYEDG